MFFIRDAIVKIWKRDEKDKYVDIQLSTSEKDMREEGKYINSYWLGRCVGKAKEQVMSMDISKNVRVKTGKVTNESYTDKQGNKKSATRVTIFEFDTDGVTKAQATKAKKSEAAPVKEEPESTEDYPF